MRGDMVSETRAYGDGWPEKWGGQAQVFDLPGLRMYGAVAGPADGPLVILLHGFPEDAYSYRHQLGPLAEAGFRVVAPDQRGYGLTDKRGPYDTATLTRDIVHLIAACGRQQAHLVGHDWGALVAWDFAERYPERLLSLSILNVPRWQVAERALKLGNPRQMLRSWYIGFFQLPWLPEALLSRGNFAPLRRTVQATARRGTFTPADLHHLTRAWRQPGALPAMLGWYRSAFRRGLRRGRPTTPRLTVPTLILWGERDVALGVELAEQSVATLANGRLVRFPDATHWVHEDCPADVTTLLLDHFQSAIDEIGGAA